MNKITDKRIVYGSLLSLANTVGNCPKGAIPALSICGWLGSKSPLTPQEYREVIVPLFEKWPKFSGSVHYPVPSGSEHMDAGEMYEKVCHTGEGLWDRTHPYGANRRELLTFLIHTLLKQIHDEENNQPTNHQYQVGDCYVTQSKAHPCSSSPTELDDQPTLMPAGLRPVRFPIRR